MNLFKLILAKFVAKLGLIAEKSIFLMLILALVWQCFPKVTSLAQTISPSDLPVHPANLTIPAPLSMEDQMAATIATVAQEENYGQPQLLIAIAKAESRLNPGIRGESDHRDRGLYQINSYFNPDVSDACAFDPVCSTKWAIGELKAGHLWKWNASRYKWGKYVYND